VTHSKFPARKTFLLFVGVVILYWVHLNVGSSTWFTPWAILNELRKGPTDSSTSLIIWTLRLPRATECLLVGATLGVVGSAFQAQFRNPLADPYIVGVSSGAAVGGVLSLIFGFGGWLGGLGMTLSGFTFGLGSLALVILLAQKRGRVDPASLLLSGVVIGSFMSAILSVSLLAAGRDTNQVLSWLLGSMVEATWPHVAVLAMTLGIGVPILFRKSRRMNALALGEDVAQRLGVDAARLRTVILTTGTAMTAAAVGTVGIVGFLGLVAPHIARRVVGVDWRWSLPGSGLIGASLLLSSDLIAQRGISAITGQVGLEIPVGIVTAILGAPTLLILLRKSSA
jgi:iron complex transport system permease protein